MWTLALEEEQREFIYVCWMGVSVPVGPAREASAQNVISNSCQ